MYEEIILGNLNHKKDIYIEEVNFDSKVLLYPLIIIVSICKRERKIIVRLTFCFEKIQIILLLSTIRKMQNLFLIC